MRVGRPRFHSRAGQEIFLYSTASRLALRHTQPPIQRAPVALSSEVKQPGRDADHSSSTTAEVKNGETIVAYLRHVRIVTSKHAPAITQ
jgi:hypothetical protein